VQRFYEEYGYWWKPAPLLEKLAATNGRFADL
jgi:3-hydroxyacyl-CoA dehydrogenase